MLFSQIEFVLLFSLTLACHAIVRHHRARKLFLLGFSYYFYAYWDWRFLGLILFSTILDYVVGRQLGVRESPRARKLLLLASLVGNLGVLGFFKYANFFIESAAVVLEPLGLHPGTLSIILPVGISFYTFQTLSYTIDVYRRRIEVCHDPCDFALFVAFFPQLVAGPIVRAADFLPALRTPRVLSGRRFFEGGRQFILGLFKKVLIADNLARFVDYQFENAGVFDGPTTWLAVAAYAVQIYCDFSGYSDMAIGVARILGYDLKDNFRYPYISSSITEFWRRWHISLSSWLRDYLYISLGGNRKGRVRTYLNLMITMLLGGLWHGAAWTFVFWGALHGAALAVHKFLGERLGGERRPSAVRQVVGWGITMVVVLVGWVFFRAAAFEQAWLMLRQMFVSPAGVSHLPPFVLSTVLVFTGHHLLLRLRGQDSFALPHERWYTPAALITMVLLVVVFHPTDFMPFIYFQF